MKSSINIAKCLRVLFGVIQILIVFVAIVAAARSLIPASKDHPLYLNYFIPKPTFNLNDSSYTILTTSSASNDIRIRELTGTLNINADSTDVQLRTRVRWVMIPAVTFALAYGFALSRCLRKLCWRIENGEMFTDANLRLVSSIGFLLVIAGVISNALVLFGHYFLGQYLVQHATMTGLKVRLESDLFKHLEYSDLVTGLLVLLTAEAFRQGLALKKENELTV